MLSNQLSFFPSKRHHYSRWTTPVAQTHVTPAEASPRKPQCPTEKVAPEAWTTSKPTAKVSSLLGFSFATEDPFNSHWILILDNFCPETTPRAHGAHGPPGYWACPGHHGCHGMQYVQPMAWPYGHPPQPHPPCHGHPVRDWGFQHGLFHGENAEPNLGQAVWISRLDQNGDTEKHWTNGPEAAPRPFAPLPGCREGHFGWVMAGSNPMVYWSRWIRHFLIGFEFDVLFYGLWAVGYISLKVSGVQWAVSFFEQVDG